MKLLSVVFKPDMNYLLLFLPLLVPSLADNCQDTKSVYPKVTAPQLTDVSKMKNLMCNMFDQSCCTFVTGEPFLLFFKYFEFLKLIGCLNI